MKNPLQSISGTLVHYKKNEILVRPSDYETAFFRIVSGLVETHNLNDNGEKYVHVLLGEEDMFPLGVLLESDPIFLYYRAATDCTVLRYSSESVLQSLHTDPAVCYGVLKQVAKQFRVYVALVDNLEYKYGQERLAYRLLLLAKKFGSQLPGTDGHIELPHINQQELGAAINLGREGVSRQMTRFTKRGYIRYESGVITILDASGLRKEIGDTQNKLFVDS